MARWNGNCSFPDMNRFTRRLSAAAVLPVLAAVAQAHPGHDGHEGGGEFTWDFSHLAAHPFATAAFVAVVGALSWGVVKSIRRERPVRVSR